MYIFFVCKAFITNKTFFRCRALQVLGQGCRLEDEGEEKVKETGGVLQGEG